MARSSKKAKSRKASSAKKAPAKKASSAKKAKPAKKASAKKAPAKKAKPTKPAKKSSPSAQPISPTARTISSESERERETHRDESPRTISSQSEIDTYRDDPSQGISPFAQTISSRSEIESESERPDEATPSPRRARSQTLEPEIISASPILPPRHERPRTVPPHPPPTRRSKAHLPPPSQIDEAWDLEPAPESSPAHPLRGRALVEKVIEKMEAEGGHLGGCGIPEHPATPMLSKEILQLALPDGRPVPPSLVRFLAYDETFLGVVEGDPPRLKLRTFREMLVEEFDEMTADIADLGHLLPGLCLVVPGGSDSRRFVYFGEADEHDEYPVMVVDVDDIPYVCLAYPGLDVYLADGVLTTVLKHSYLDGYDGPYGPEMVEQARRNFHGFKSLDLGGGEVEHVDGPAAVAPLLEQLFGPVPPT